MVNTQERTQDIEIGSHGIDGSQELDECKENFKGNSYENPEFFPEQFR